MQITIVGCGISGLSCGIRLQQEGHSVRIVAREIPPHTTSNRAAAFWSPYYAFGEKASNRALFSYHHFMREAVQSPAAGITITQLWRMLPEGAEDEEDWMDAIPPDRIRALEKTELLPGYASGYVSDVPLIESQLYLPWLMDSFQLRGGNIQQQTIRNWKEVLGSCDLIINCAGLGARELAQDSALYPVRGQIVLVDYRSRLPIFLDESRPVYLVQRQDGLILGGTREDFVEDQNTENESIARIIQSCNEINPGVADAPILRTWAGLRPQRYAVRLERDPHYPIIHNYGHGGAGFTFSWGCAEEVADLVNDD